MKNYMLILGGIIGLSGWGLLLLQDWKIGLAVMLIMWGTNK